MKELKEEIQTALGGFSSGSLAASATRLLNVLGYESERTIQLSPNNYKGFFELFQAVPSNFDQDKAKVKDWQSIDIIFQLTEDDIKKSHSLFEAKRVDNTIIESYLFFALSLAGEKYTRGDLVKITREINKLTPMPAMVLFKYGAFLTIAIIRRRLHRRDETKDVLEKVTLIKDIRFADPLRAHLEILSDLSVEALYKEFYFHNFVGLHMAWEKRLDSYALNERFYREIANWYFWALQHSHIVYPRDIQTEENRSIFLIRLLTRLIFCWFLQEKGLVPSDLFRRHYVAQTLKDFAPEAGTYYRAFLQNLFFGTLNQEVTKREFRKKYEGSRGGNRGVTTLYRYQNLLSDPKAFTEKLKMVPFVNGGLFDCLDIVYRKEEKSLTCALMISQKRRGTIFVFQTSYFSEKIGRSI